MPFIIREIQKSDNEALSYLIRETLIEYGFVRSEYIKNPEKLANLYEDFKELNGKFFVIFDQKASTVVGGGGYCPLIGTNPEEKICGLQKMYLLKNYRGKGLGKKLMNEIVKNAAKDGFKAMYLETGPELKEAISLYEKSGFKFIKERLGNTGHLSCNVFMLRGLEK